MTAKLYLNRHGERDLIPDGEVGNDILLTDHGLSCSTNFGEKLQGKVTQIKSSPIERCFQTAQMIAKGSRYPQSDIEFCSTLGAPGIFIENGELAWQHWEKHGADGVNKYLLYSNEKWQGFKDILKAASYN